MKIIFFVPARSGSLGIKNKNLAKLNGRPLLHYTLKICQKFRKSFDTFISTDSYKIIKYCKNFGFKADYKRPRHLSSSYSNIIHSIFHGVNWYEKKHKTKITHVVLLQPTSPLRKINELKRLISMVKKKKIESITTVTKVRENYLGHIKLSTKNCKKKNLWKYINKRGKKIVNRQEYSKNHYFFNGSVYISSIQFLKR